MDWRLTYYSARTGRIGHHSFDRVDHFINGARMALDDIRNGRFSAALPDGRTLDEEQLRALVGR
jgi:hypothetical protein